MLLEVRAASRKTPSDGRFEVSPATAARLTMIGARVDLEFNDVRAEATVEHMVCSCAKADEPGTHQHHFLVSELFRAMEPGRMYAAELVGARLVRVAGTPDGLK